MLFRVGHAAPGPRPTLTISRRVLWPPWPESDDLVAHQHTLIRVEWLQKRYENATKFVLEFKMAAHDPEVAGSNPAPATNECLGLRVCGVFVCAS